METVMVTCPYCNEQMEISIEQDVQGTLVQDCEVCCRPWLLTVRWKGKRLQVRAERAQ
jgi:hypothetical protein